LKFRLLRTPALDLCLCLISGVLLGRIAGVTIVALSVLAVFAVASVLLARLPAGFRLLPALFVVAGFALVIRAGAVFDSPRHITSFVPTGKATLYGRVITGFRYFQDGYRFTMRAEQIETGGRKSGTDGLITVSVYKGKTPPLPGDRIILRQVKAKPIVSFRNIGGFDYERFMKDRGIGARVSISDEKRMEIRPPPFTLDFRRFGETLRRSVHRFIGEHFPPNTAPIASAMTVGITGGVNPDVRRAFAVSGLAHLLAISGLHVGFVTGVAYLLFYGLFFLLSFRFKPSLGMSGAFRKPAVIFSLLTGLIFVLATGTRISAVRAGIMVGIYLFSVMLDREKEPLNALAVSAILILFFNPTALFTASFQMSYIAVLAIILLFSGEEEDEDPLEKLEPKIRFERAGRFFAGAVRISIAVGLAVAPVVMANFSEIHMGGFLANIIAVPLASVAIPVTLIASLFGSFSHTLGNILAVPGVLAFGGIEFTAEFFSRLHLFSFAGPPFPPALVFFYYAVYAAWIFRKEISRAWLAGATSLLAAALVFNYAARPRAATEIHFFDVGQGDSTLIMLKNGRNILIDGGTKLGRMDAGAFVVVPALNRLKVRKLDAVIATHGDNDHAGGLETVMKRIKVERYFDNGQKKKRQALERLRRTAVEMNIKSAVLKAGMTVPAGGGALRTVSPSQEFLEIRKPPSINDASLGLLLESEGEKVFFTADIGRTAEKYLVSSGADIKADVLKVGHHGSNTGTTGRFLDAVSPKAAVISAGRFNRFGFPSKKVLARLARRKIRTLNTMNEGEIVLTIKDGAAAWHSYAHPSPTSLVGSEKPAF